VAAEMAGASVPDTKASSRSRVMPVRWGFSRFNRSINSASCGGTTRDRLRSQGGKTTAAIAQCPIEQGIDRKRVTLGVGDFVVACGNLLRAASEFSARESLQD
jgi:hypothetical protein